MSLHDYAGMLLGSPRVAAFREAIEGAVKPGMRVLDLGTGLGTYAMFAARAGAARVVAVDSDPVVHLARAIALHNGLADRIEFVHARAPEGIPDGAFDLVIFEDYPTTFLDEGTWRLLEAVAAGHIAPGGALLPAGVRFALAPVTRPPGPSAPAAMGEEHSFLGLDWSELRTHLANTGRKVHLPLGALGGEARAGPRRPILPLPRGEELGAEGEWTAGGDPVVALAYWFDLDLGGGRWVSNAPGERGEPWGQWLLPVDPPLEAAAGSPLSARVWREIRPDGAPGWMGWACEAGGVTRRGHEFAGLPLSMDDVRGRGREGG